MEFFSALPKITEYMKKANKFRMANERVSHFRMDKCKECIKHGKPGETGKINYQTLKGLAMYEKGIKLLSKFVPKCLRKYKLQVKLATIKAEHRDLCLLLPTEWQSECLARADGCMKVKDYPYTRPELDKCEWIRQVYNKPVVEPEVNNDKADVIGFTKLEAPPVTLINTLEVRSE